MAETTHCDAQFMHAMHTTPNGICWGQWKPGPDHTNGSKDA